MSRNWWGESLDLSPIEVQGLTIRPGDEILVLDNSGVAHTHVYAGFRAGPIRWYYTAGEPSTMFATGCGPHLEHQLRHPDILTGLAKELGENG